MRASALVFPALLSGSFAGYSEATTLQDVFAPPDALQNILQNTEKTDKYRYPTDFTRDIVPKPFHSHNDYWRNPPFYAGLSYGAISTEADVWLVNGTLYVGHEPAALTPARTLASLYIDPILSTLTRLNPTTPFTTKGSQNGVYDTSSGQTLYLFIDMKTSPDTTWPAILAALAPLRSANYLTTWTGTERFNRPITVVGTGNTQLSDVQAYLPRDVFFDAPLADLSNSKYANLTINESPIASTDFKAVVGEVRKKELNDTQLGLLRSQIARAKELGIMARYWDTPGWPIGTRNAVWRTLWDEGVGLLNVDDLKAASEFWEGSG